MKSKVIPAARQAELRDEAIRLKLNRREAAAMCGVNEKTAQKIMRGLPRVSAETQLQNLRAAIVSADLAQEMIAARENGERWAEIAERFGISVNTAKSAVARALGQSPRHEPKTGQCVGFTRVRFAGGCTLTVSHGEGEEYARSMVEAMTAGRSVASVEVVR